MKILNENKPFWFRSRFKSNRWRKQLNDKCDTLVFEGPFHGFFSLEWRHQYHLTLYVSEIEKFIVWIFAEEISIEHSYRNIWLIQTFTCLQQPSRECRISFTFCYQCQLVEFKIGMDHLFLGWNSNRCRYCLCSSLLPSHAIGPCLM